MGTTRSWLAMLVAAVVGMGISGCAGTSRSGSDAPGVTLPAPASAGPAVFERQSIALHSAKDLAATFRSNGISDPEHWARVVTDHEPYPTDDPSLAKLRAVLAQEHIDPGQGQRILDLLAP